MNPKLKACQEGITTHSVSVRAAYDTRVLQVANYMQGIAGPSISADQVCIQNRNNVASDICAVQIADNAPFKSRKRSDSVQIAACKM